MKKKLFILFTLLLCLVSNGAWATQSYTWNLKTLQTTEITGSVNTIPTASYVATDANGSNTVTLYIQLANNGSDKINTDGVRFNGSSGTGTVNNVSNTNQRTIYFVAPCAGHVTVTGYTSSTSKNMYIGTSFNAKTTEDGMLDTDNNGSASNPFTMEADIASGATCWIYSDGTAYTTNIVFEETAAKTQWDAPEISASGWNGTNWTITITGETGASLKYKTKASAEGEYSAYADYSATFTAVPGTYVKAYAYDATPTYSNSDETEFVVPAKPTVPTPTLTVASYNYVNGGYSITPYCEDGSATLEYKFGSDENYTSCTSGTPFYVVGSGVDNTANKLTLKATKSGWTQSAAYFSGLNVAPSTTSPETLIPWAVANNSNYETNKEHIYRSVTMGKVNAQDIGQTNGNVWKLRTGTNSNTVTLSVNSGYKVKRVSLTGYSVNSETGQTISLSKVSVDGADYNTSPGVTFPIDNGTNTKDTETYDSGEGNDMDATSSIVFTFDNSNITTGYQTQIWATEIKVWYELVPDPIVSFPGGSRVGYSVSGTTETPTSSGYTLKDVTVYQIQSEKSVTLTIPATTVVSKIVVSGTSASDNSSSSYITITRGDQTKDVTFNGRKQDIVTDKFVPTAQSTTYTITQQSGTNKNSWVQIAVYGTEHATVSVGAKGYATYCNANNALDFTGKSIKAYTISSTNGSALTLTQKNKVAKGEPVLLYSATNNDSKNIPVIADSEATADENNKLVAGTGAALTWTEGTAEHYILYTGGETPGFYRANNSTVAVGKAYLDLTGVNAARVLSFDLNLDGDVTAITNIEAKANAKSDKVYNLNGQQVAQPTKGLYIVNGKKVIIK